MSPTLALFGSWHYLAILKSQLSHIQIFVASNVLSRVFMLQYMHTRLNFDRLLESKLENRITRSNTRG